MGMIMSRRLPCLRYPQLAFLLALALVAGGCSRGGRPAPTRYPVSGTVTMDGQPLQVGEARFITVSEGLIDVLPIKDGRFSGMAAGGDRRVEFYIVKELPFAESGYKLMPGETPPTTVKVQMLPPHLNTEGSFNATVAPEGRNEFTFELSAQPLAAGKR